MADTRLKVVTIMNYPPEPRLRQMCYAFLDSVLRNGAKSVTILYENEPPVVSPEHRRLADIEVVNCRSHDVGHPHFNLRFKLANLAKIDYSFLFLDADMYVLGDLNELWNRRNDKPWIGIDHERIESDLRTHRSPFLNSGLQLVSNPAFYDLEAILAVQNAAAPLRRSADYSKYEMFACPGADQAVLYRYFRTIGYDYTHAQIGPAWNCCAGVTEIKNSDGKWNARTVGLPANHDVQILHYWSQFKPWTIACPIFESYAGHGMKLISEVE